MSSFISGSSGDILRDREWVRASFMLAGGNIDNAFQRWRFSTHAALKFTDTRLGGNWPINNLPQYCRFADIRHNGINPGNDGVYDLNNVGNYGGRLGMGRYYSEQIDDNSQLIHLQFGQPVYNGMVSFFTGFFDNDSSMLANEGRVSISYYLGVALGVVVSLPIAPYLMLGELARFLLARPSSKYFYLKNTPGLYLNRVNLIANTIGVNMGIVPRVLKSRITTNNLENAGLGTTVPVGTMVGSTEEGADMDAPAGSTDDTDYRAFAHRMAPDVFREDGGINIYGVINKTQRMADQYYTKLRQDMETANDSQSMRTTLLNYVEDTYGGGAKFKLQPVTEPGQAASYDEFGNYLIKYHKTPMGDPNFSDKENAAARINSDASSVGPETTVTSDSNNPDSKQTQANVTQKEIRDKWIPDPNNSDNQLADPGYGNTSLLKYWLSNRQDGSDTITFRVDYTGTTNESFTNGVRESDISSKINGISSSAREARFTFSDGNTGIGLIDQAIDSVRSLAAGVLDGVHMGGLLSLSGAGFVDIPKHWENSTVSMPTSTYTIELRSVYGNKFARFINLMVPLSCLLAGVLPISTGKASYTNPFYVQLFSRGRTTIRTGLIDSLSITRGAGNMGWTRTGECLGIDISFSVVDLTSNMHFPIDTGFNILKPWKGILDDDNPATDYFASLGNLSMADQIYRFRKLALNLTRKKEQVDTFFSKAHFASAMDNYWPTRAVGSLVGGLMRASETSTSNG